jgi:glycosyltransferase involved in cell wall biosynthesis
LNNCSLIIATYNWPQALELCLKSVQQQKIFPTEVIIADDGSKKETADLIRSFQKKFTVPVIHIWHPDEGFRLAAIRNKGIAAATTDYIIQIDGDLILHPYFIADHLEIKRNSFFSAGSRVMLSQKTSQNLLANHSTDIYKLGERKRVINGMRNRFLRNLLSERYKIKGRHQYYVKGCNMAFFKADLVKVNGYNETFNGWGSEDRELCIRLINAGIKKQAIKWELYVIICIITSLRGKMNL